MHIQTQYFNSFGKKITLTILTTWLWQLLPWYFLPYVVGKKLKEKKCFEKWDIFIFCLIYAKAKAESNGPPLLTRFRSSISACSLSSVSLCCCWRNRISFSREAMRVSVLGWTWAAALGLLMSTGGDLTI